MYERYMNVKILIMLRCFFFCSTGQMKIRNDGATSVYDVLLEVKMVNVLLLISNLGPSCQISCLLQMLIMASECQEG